uniref:PH domain-containing protein n=1 Tax=Ascaris lumbricoides TaxID=6252 RepID=A0A0M3ICI0_ASCLU
MDKKKWFFMKRYLVPCRNFRKEQLLPLRSDWRFPESGAVAYGNVEIRRSVAFFWTRASTRFCAITDQGFLLIYGETEKGLAIDLKSLLAVHSNIAEKKVNRTVTSRCLITLRHKCGDSIVMCIRGKNEIAKWRCAICSIIQFNDQNTETDINRRGEQFTSHKRLDETNIPVSTPVDPGDVDYWNNPAAGKQMTSPKIYRALSQHALMHRLINSSSRATLGASTSLELSTASRTTLGLTTPDGSRLNTDHIGGRMVRTLSRKYSLRTSIIPNFMIGSIRKHGSSAISLLQDVKPSTPSSDECNDTCEETSEAPSPVFSMDSGVASRVDSPALSRGQVFHTFQEGMLWGREGQDEERSYNGHRECLQQNHLANCMALARKGASDYSTRSHQSAPETDVAECMKRPRVVLPPLCVDNLNVEGIFEEVLCYLKDSYWR